MSKGSNSRGAAALHAPRPRHATGVAGVVGTTQAGLAAPALIALLAAAPFLAPEPVTAAPQIAPSAAPAAAPSAARSAAPAAQLGGWEAIAPEGATCGQGAPFEFFLSRAQSPDAGIVLYLNGGGACVKQGPAPEGASGPAQALYCMDFPNFQDLFLSRLTVGIAANLFAFGDRNDGDNPFRDDHLVIVPYCTGDVHVGRMTTAFDYDPTDAEFPVVHRGHLNVLAVLDELEARLTETRQSRFVLTGASAGAIGAIFNFPYVIERWPNTVLLPDAGIAPGHPDSLLVREGASIAERWSARVHLPDYCPSDDCMTDTSRLLAAHAAHHDGESAPWRPFGYLQAQQDGTLSDYFEVERCSYQVSLRAGVRRAQAQPNLRAFIPASSQHVLSNRGLDGSVASTADGTQAPTWFRAVGAATSAAELPPDAIDPWLSCNELALPWMSARR